MYHWARTEGGTGLHGAGGAPGAGTGDLQWCQYPPPSCDHAEAGPNTDRVCPYPSVLWNNFNESQLRCVKRIPAVLSSPTERRPKGPCASYPSGTREQRSLPELACYLRCKQQSCCCPASEDRWRPGCMPLSNSFSEAPLPFACTQSSDKHTILYRLPGMSYMIHLLGAHALACPGRCTLHAALAGDAVVPLNTFFCQRAILE